MWRLPLTIPHGTHFTLPTKFRSIRGLPWPNRQSSRPMGALHAPFLLAVPPFQFIIPPYSIILRQSWIPHAIRNLTQKKRYSIPPSRPPISTHLQHPHATEWFDILVVCFNQPGSECNCIESRLEVLRNKRRTFRVGSSNSLADISLVASGCAWSNDGPQKGFRLELLLPKKRGPAIQRLRRLLERLRNQITFGCPGPGTSPAYTKTSQRLNVHTKSEIGGNKSTSTLHEVKSTTTLNIIPTPSCGLSAFLRRVRWYDYVRLRTQKCQDTGLPLLFRACLRAVNLILSVLGEMGWCLCRRRYGVGITACRGKDVSSRHAT